MDSATTKFHTSGNLSSPPRRSSDRAPRKTSRPAPLQSGQRAPRRLEHPGDDAFTKLPVGGSVAEDDDAESLLKMDRKIGLKAHDRAGVKQNMAELGNVEAKATIVAERREIGRAAGRE